MFWVLGLVPYGRRNQYQSDIKFGLSATPMSGIFDYRSDSDGALSLRYTTTTTEELQDDTRCTMHTMLLVHPMIFALYGVYNIIYSYICIDRTKQTTTGGT